MSRKLLIVDDEPEIARIIETVAERCGYAAHVLSDSMAFERTYTTIGPDFLTLDLAMPGRDGIEIMQFLAAEGATLPILLISGFNERVLEVAARLGEARGLRIAGAMLKPIRVNKLRTLLEGLLGGDNVAAA